MLNSPVDIAVLFGVALLVFGPKRLPELGKSLGQGIGNFKKSLQEAQDQVKTAINEPTATPAASTDGAVVPPAPQVATPEEATTTTAANR